MKRSQSAYRPSDCICHLAAELREGGSDIRRAFPRKVDFFPYSRPHGRHCATLSRWTGGLSRADSPNFLTFDLVLTLTRSRLVVRERCRAKPSQSAPQALVTAVSCPHRVYRLRGIADRRPHTRWSFRRLRRRTDELRTEVVLPTTSRPRGLWASMRHPGCPGELCVSTQTQRWCHRVAFSKQQCVYGYCPIPQVFLVFPRHTADVNLEARPR